MTDMDRKFKILLLEDSPEDVDLIERELKRGGIDFTSVVVRKKDEYEKALYTFDPDVILSDHSLPQFNSIEAMELWKKFQKEKNAAIPFILVTGSVSEEFAVQSIKAGAVDYILKDRLRRLPSSIVSAVEKAEIENERANYLAAVMSQSALMKEAEHLAHFGSWQVNLLTGKHQWSDEAFRIFGFTPGEVEPNYEKFLQHVHPDDRGEFKKRVQEAIDHLDYQECEFRIVGGDQKTRILQTRILVKRDADRRAYEAVGFTLDVTEQKAQTRVLETQNRKLMEIAWVQSHEVRAPLARLMGLAQLLKTYPQEKVDINLTLAHLLESADALDGIIRKIVRKTEEIV